MNKKIILISSGSIFTVILIGIIVFAMIKSSIRVSLNGDKKTTVTINEKYKEKGIVVKKGNKEVKKSKYKLTIKNNVNTSKLGNYKVNYNVRYFLGTYNLTREVSVVDDVKPELTLNLEKVDRDYCTRKFKQEITYNAVDNYDGDITDKVKLTEKDDKMIYSVKDSSGNESIKEVKINYGDKPANKFFVNGNAKVKVLLNSEYIDQGASYTDGCGNKIDKEIKSSGKVDTSKVGEYIITYSVDGENSITRTVEVYEKVFSNKTIYLTFDDGPGKNTKTVLSVLDKYNVKATFFVTNQFPGYKYLIAEEYKKGHAIGVHTLTHKWNVYDSLDAYLNDFNAMNEIVKEQTGSYTKLFRFPGGSGNTVSISHSKGVVTLIAEEMTKRGYVYFDWNLSSGDADGKTTTNKIISNVVNRVENCSAECVILFHDYKPTTAAAIEPILKELVSRGYKFATLSESGPIVHAKIKN